jgi:hypothetical protein
VCDWDHVTFTTEYVPKNISGYDQRTVRTAAPAHEARLPGRVA